MEDRESQGQPPPPEEAGTRAQLSYHTKQLDKLWQVNSEQSRQLAKLEDVPSKIDQLLSLNTALATLSQLSQSHAAELVSLRKDLRAQEDAVAEVDKKMSTQFGYYAGALAVAGLVFGVVVWFGQQAVSGAFAEIASVHQSLSSIQGDVSALKFQAGRPAQGEKR